MLARLLGPLPRCLLLSRTYNTAARLNIKHIHMSLAGWEVRIYGIVFKTEVTGLYYMTDPKPVNNLFIFFLSRSN